MTRWGDEHREPEDGDLMKLIARYGSEKMEAGGASLLSDRQESQALATATWDRIRVMVRALVYRASGRKS